MALPTSISKSIKRQGRSLLTTGSRFKRFDQIRQRHLWSTYLFVPDANGYVSSGEAKVFLTPDSQAGQGFPVALSALETDFKGTGRVPDNQNLSISEIGVTLGLCPPEVAPEGDTAGIVNPAFTAATLFQNALVAITYLTNTVELGFVEDFAQPAGPQVGSYVPTGDITPGGATYINPRFVTNGFAGPGLRRRFKIPIMLGHGETFNFSYLLPRAFWVGDVVLYARLDLWVTETFVEKS